MSTLIQAGSLVWLWANGRDSPVSERLQQLQELVDEMTEVILEGWHRHAHEVEPDLAHRVRDVLARAGHHLYRKH